MTREEIALRIFCAMLSRADSLVSIAEPIGEQQVKTAFMLATTFEHVRDRNREVRPAYDDH